MRISESKGGLRSADSELKGGLRHFYDFTTEKSTEDKFFHTHILRTLIYNFLRKKIFSNSLFRDFRFFGYCEKFH